uniref:non-specific serine/threonine protein kinase n=1 Tax=viral metagenome TaxID=1070528 RepID=A0A6C0IVH5_9ZZZZ
MSLITKKDLSKLIKTDTIDVSIFLLETLKNIYNIVENNKQLTANEKLLEISNIFNTICYPQIEENFNKPTTFTKRFTDIEIIKSGGFGIVYKARHYLDNKLYAIKRIPLFIDFEDKENISKILLNKLKEIRILANIQHKNIIDYKTSWIEPDNSVYNYCLEKEEFDLSFSNSDDEILVKSKNFIRFNIFYQMELMDCSLRDYMMTYNTNLNNKSVITIIKSILNALNYLHNLETPVIHMDIKPENILIKLNKDKTIKEIKLADFGLIKNINDNSIEEDGTYLYKSPERSKHIYNTSCDIYSLGIVIYELFNNWPTQMERIKMITMLKNNSEIIDDLKIVQKMISDDYMKRPTAKQLLDILEEII